MGIRSPSPHLLTLGPKLADNLFAHPSFVASLVAQMVKYLPAMQETRVRSLGQEDPLEKEMATCSSTHPSLLGG